MEIAISVRDVLPTLIRAGLYPQDAALSERALAQDSGRDLMPAIIRAWQESGDSSPTAVEAHDAAQLAILQARQRAGSQLTCNVPGDTSEVAALWLGNRLAWWPRGVLAGRRVGVASSRLGRNLEQRKAWFAALRTACMRLDPTRDVLLTSEAITSQRFVQRCGQLFGIPVLCLGAEREGTLRDWARRILADEAPSRDSEHHVYLSPSLSDGKSSTPTQEQPARPMRDRAMMAISDLLIVLRVRANGNIQRLLESRLARSEYPAASVFLALGEGLVPRKIAEPLMDRGAVGWYIMDGDPPAKPAAPPPWTSPTVPAAPIIKCPSAQDWAYLTHCTRRRPGPWPDQDENAYLDDLLLDRDGADHSALAALWRIVRNRCLLASNDLIRGDQAVVSLTAVPLQQIHRLRTFRSHLSRWDFEPYGICIRRDWLQKQGARPVHYGDDSLWEQLSATERPFFQKRQSQTRSGAVMDWRVEREWRLIGDLRLDNVPSDAAFVFVPSWDEARQLATVSPWPIAILASESGEESSRQ
jgi:hypothetical protein